MKFIEMTGATFAKVVDGEQFDLRATGIKPDTIVRINEQGDVEVRRREGWDVVGGLLGGYEDRLRKTSGMEWA